MRPNFQRFIDNRKPLKFWKVYDYIFVKWNAQCTNISCADNLTPAISGANEICSAAGSKFWTTQHYYHKLHYTEVFHHGVCVTKTLFKLDWLKNAIGMAA